MFTQYTVFPILIENTKETFSQHPQTEVSWGHDIFSSSDVFKSFTEISSNDSTKLKERDTKEKSKCASNLADQGVQGEDENLLVLQDVGGDKVEQALVGGQLDWCGGAYQGEVLVGAGNLKSTRYQGDDCSLEANSATKQTWQSVRSRNLCSSARKIW